MEGGHTRVFVTFGLHGDIVPDAVTRCLGIAPTSSFVRGAVIGPGHSGRVHDHSAWFLESDRALGDTIGPHLDWLLDELEPVASEIASLREGDVWARVDCFWSSAGMSGGPWVTADAMRRLAALDLDLVISFYVSD